MVATRSSRLAVASKTSKKTAQAGKANKATKPTQATTKSVKAAKAETSVPKSNSGKRIKGAQKPEIKWREDSQEAEYEVYAEKSKHSHASRSESAKPSDIFSFIQLPYDIVETIILYTEDQQALHAWQRVCYYTYRLATPILYSRPITLSTDRGYDSILRGTLATKAVTRGLKQNARVTPKVELLPLVTSVDIAGYLRFEHSRNAYRFINVPVSLFSGLKTLAITGHGDLWPRGYWCPEGLMAWAGRLGIQRLQIGHDRQENDIPARCQDRLGTYSLTTWFFSRFAGGLCLPPSVCRLYGPWSRLTTRIYQTLRVFFKLVVWRGDVGFFDFLINLVAERSATAFAGIHIYGIGQDVAHRLNNAFIARGRDYKPSVHDDYEPNIQGTEAESQALVEKFFRRFLDDHILRRLWLPKIQFRLGSELRPLEEV